MNNILSLLQNRKFSIDNLELCILLAISQNLIELIPIILKIHPKYKLSFRLLKLICLNFSDNELSIFEEFYYNSKNNLVISLETSEKFQIIDFLKNFNSGKTNSTNIYIEIKNLTEFNKVKNIFKKFDIFKYNRNDLQKESLENYDWENYYLLEGSYIPNNKYKEYLLNLFNLSKKADDKIKLIEYIENLKIDDLSYVQKNGEYYYLDVVEYENKDYIGVFATDGTYLQILTKSEDVEKILKNNICLKDKIFKFIEDNYGKR